MIGMIPGYAQVQESGAFLKRKGVMSRKAGSFSVSPLAIGTHLGEMNRVDSLLYQEAILCAVDRGINMVDTALNYRGMRSERDIGECLTEAAAAGHLKREEIVISTKAGILPGDIDAALVPKNYLREVLLKREIIQPDEIQVLNHYKHVLSPSYFEFAIGESRKHMNIETIDLYFVHNPEYSLIPLGEREFYRQLTRLFVKLEDEAALGHIRHYGIATWDGLISSPEAVGYLSLERIITCAREAGGEEHHFVFIQLPLNPDKPEARQFQNQRVKGRWLTVIEAAHELGIHVTVSSPLQAGAVPEKKQALSTVLQTEGILAAMVGMKRKEHVEENIEAILI